MQQDEELDGAAVTSANWQENNTSSATANWIIIRHSFLFFFSLFIFRQPQNKKKYKKVTASTIQVNALFKLSNLSRTGEEKKKINK